MAKSTTVVTPEPESEIVRNVPGGMMSRDQMANMLELGYTELIGQSIDSAVVFQSPELVHKLEKRQLVGRAFHVLGWRFNPGEYGPRGFVSVSILTDENKYMVFNDGSTGVLAQLDEFTTRTGMQQGPIHCRQGLRVSDYWRDPDTGETYTVKPDDVHTEPATTYYLS